MSFGLRSRKSKRRFGKRTDMDRTTGKSSFGDRVKTAIRKANKTANKAAEWRQDKDRRSKSKQNRKQSRRPCRKSR